MIKINIIGAGIAGLSAALTLAEKGIRCRLISAQNSERAQSVLAEGGINAALTMLLYKPVVTALRRAHLLKENEESSGHRTKIGVVIVSAVLFVTFILLALVLAKVI